MLLEMGTDGAKFKPNRVEGVDVINDKPGWLILDGQQRLTSLFLALKNTKPIRTQTEKGDEIKRFYYMDILKCLDEKEDRFDAVLSIPEDRKLKSDFNRKVDLDISDAEKEYANKMFPLSIVFDNERFADWRRGFNKHYGYDADAIKLFDAFEAQVVSVFRQYRIIVIELKQNTPKEAVCQVFEKVNTGGVALTVFELMTAMYSAEEFNLKMDWTKRKEKFSEYGPIENLEPTDFLTSMALLVSYKGHLKGGLAVSCKRKDVLQLSKDDYVLNADDLTRGIINAAKLMGREKIFDSRNLPYQTQLIPLGAICAYLGDKYENDNVKQKLLRWFWCGVFGELYGGANESRYAFDVVEVLAWIDGGGEPRTIRDANFTPLRLLSLQSRQSAAYKGLMVKLMQIGSIDFLSGDAIELTMYYDEAVDIHHLFPKDYCLKMGLPREKWNSVINKAPLTAKTNRIIGGKAPSVYLGEVEKRGKLSSERLDEIVESHLVSSNLLRDDDFDAFIRGRASKLLDLIEKSMGKAVAGRDSEEAVKSYGDVLV
jgi:hypothetical protein